MTAPRPSGETARLAPLARQAGTAPQSEYGNLAGFGDRRDPIGQTGRRGKTERPVVPETSRRRGRGQRNGSETFGHGRHSDRSPLPRRSSSPAERAGLPESAADLPELDRLFWDTLDAGLDAAGLELSTPVRAAIDGHVRLLLAWNAQINLTALRSPEQIARNHVLDSLICSTVLTELAGSRASILDIGSGAGFPGLPLGAFMGTRRVCLVDSIGKKARFLNVAAHHVRQALAGGGPEPQDQEIDVLAERAEDLADEPDHREKWDLVVARAIGSVAEVAELGLPLAKRGGHVAAWKFDAGDGSLQREVAEAARICQAAGGATARIVALAAAESVGLDGHCLVVVRKRRPTPDRYPRQPGERRRAP